MKNELRKIATIILIVAAFAACKGGGTSNNSGSFILDGVTYEEGQGGGSPGPIPYGTQIGAYKEIPAYSNYKIEYPENPHGIVGRIYGTYGWQYQCVEYVNRFYIQALGHTGYTCGDGNMRKCGNAVNYYDNYVQLALDRYSNGGIVSPTPDDILVFSGPTSTSNGHVAIVKEIYSDGIKIIQQNWYNNNDDNDKFISMSVVGGIYLISSLMSHSGSYTVRGWLRKPGTITPQLGISPSSGTPGTMFTLSGTGFSASSSVTSHLKQPDGTELPAWTRSTDSQGNYLYSVDSSSFIPGDYYAWIVDNKTNTTSNFMRFSVVSSQGVTTLVLTNISSVYSPQRLYQDTNYIYWTEYGGNAGGNIKKISKSGGNIITLISGLSNPSGLSSPVDIVVDSSNIYWNDLGNNTSGSGIINKIPLNLNNWNITVLASNQTTPRGIAVDGSYVYWAEEGSGLIKRVSISGGSMDTLASGLNGPRALAIDDSYVYWVENAGMSVKKANKSNKTVSVLASGLPCTPANISIDNSNVYWGDDAFGLNCGIRAVSKNGGTVISLILNLTGGIYALSTDGNYVYYIEAGNRIMKIAVSGGGPVKVIDNLDSAFDLAVDSNYVYWIENGAARKIAKILK